jgi:hypothetical protein
MVLRLVRQYEKTRAYIESLGIDSATVLVDSLTPVGYQELAQPVRMEVVDGVSTLARCDRAWPKQFDWEIINRAMIADKFYFYSGGESDGA